MFGEEIVKSVIDAASKFIPDPVERDKFALEMARMDLQYQQAQTDVNKVEAANEHIFISGWRPFIGWCCGVALAYHFILQPLLAFLFAMANHPVALPIFNMDTLNTILMGMLGLGGMRTLEKIRK